MTLALSGNEVGAGLEEKFPGSVLESSQDSILVKSESLLPVAAYLKDTPGLDFDYLANVTAVDYYDY